MKYRFFIPVFFLIFFACTENTNHKNDYYAPVSNEYAENFNIEKKNGRTIIKIIEPYPGAESQIIVLPDRMQNKIPEDTVFVQTPVKHYIATSVTHLQALKHLGVIDKMVAFPRTDYIADPEIIERVKKNKIIDIGDENMMNTEEVLRLNPQVIFAFSGGRTVKNYDLFAQKGIPVIYIAEWLEHHPLGRAEWIKVFGVFFKQENKADSLFDLIKNNYEHIIKSAVTGKSRPKIFQGGRFGDKWYVPGGKSWAAKLVKDAGGEYLIRNEETGSTLLNNEQALLLLEQADIWINPGIWRDLKQLQQDFPQVKNFKVFEKQNIFSAYIKKNASGKNEFFEKSVLRPDKLLEDYFRIFSGKTDSLYFMQKLPG
jgi:iron complex transport system substrate-binding protein